MDLSKFHLDQLGQLVASERKKRGMSLREAAEDSGITFNTLARIEKGHIPDLTRFKRLVEWCGADVSQFFEEMTRVETTPDLIAEHLRTDPNLPMEAAEHISSLVRDLYRALVTTREITAAHLRTAKTFRPPAAVAMAELLGDMEAALKKDPKNGSASRI